MFCGEHVCVDVCVCVVCMWCVCMCMSVRGVCVLFFFHHFLSFDLCTFPTQLSILEWQDPRSGCTFSKEYMIIIFVSPLSLIPLPTHIFSYEL